MKVVIIEASNEHAKVDISQALSVPMKRFTFDVPADLHKRIKTGCAARGTKMTDFLREFLHSEFPAKP